MDIKKISSFAFGPIASAFLGLMTVPLIAWGFSPEDVGRFNLYQVTVSFVLLLTVLGLDQAYVREYHEVNDKGKLLRSCALPGLLFLIVLTLFATNYYDEVSSYLYGFADLNLYLLTIISFYVSYASRFLSLMLRMEERGWAYSLTQILPKFVHLLFLIVIWVFSIKTDFSVLLASVVGSGCLVLLLYGWNCRSETFKALNARTDIDTLVPLMKFGSPLIFSSLVYWGLTATTTLSLRFWSTLDELAVFSVAMSFAGAAIVLQSIFTVVWAPTVYKWIANGKDMTVIDSILKQALALICLVITFCGSLSWLVSYILPAHYATVQYILICAMMQPVLYTLSEITCVGIGIKRSTMYSIWITLAALLTSLIFCYFLVPKFGAAGAAVSNALAFTVFFIGRTEVSARIWRSVPRAGIYIAVFLLLFLSVLTVFSKDAFPVTMPAIWAFMFFISMYFYRSELIEISAKFRSKKYMNNF